MRVYLFDIDGTLISSGGAGRLALADAMLSAFDTPVVHKVELHGRTDRWIALQLLAMHRIDTTDDNVERLLSHYLQLLPQKLAERRGQVLPGVRTLLETLLADEEAAVGLLTGNTRRGADVKLTHFDIHSLVNSSGFGGFGDVHDDRNLVASDAVSSAEAAVGRSLPLTNVWIIGDTPRDVYCARAVGAKVAAVATGGYGMDELAKSQPDLLLESLENGLPVH